MNTRQRNLLTAAVIVLGIGIILRLNFFLIQVIPLAGFILVLLALNEGPTAPPAAMDLPPSPPPAAATTKPRKKPAKGAKSKSTDPDPWND